MTNNPETSDSKLPAQAAPQDESSPTSAFSEFAKSVYAAGSQLSSSFVDASITKKIDGLKQLAGGQVDLPAPKTDLHGLNKLAAVVGTTAGEVLDFTLEQKGVGALFGAAAKVAGRVAPIAELTKSADSSLSNLINSTTSHLSSEQAAARLLQTKRTLGSMPLAGTTGLIDGLVFTPTQDGESRWRNAAVQAGTFTTLGGVGSWYGDAFGKSLLGRAQLNLRSGLAAGYANTNLDAWTRGKTASVEEQLMGSVGFAAGNVLLGEGLHRAGVGITSMRSSDFMSEKIPQFASTKIADVAETESAETRKPPSVEMVDMAELARSGDYDSVQQKLKEYYPKLERAFPLLDEEGNHAEIEKPETYFSREGEAVDGYLGRGYTVDADHKWHMRILETKQAAGGMQYQEIPVDGDNVKKAFWLEHIFVNDESRGQGYAEAMLKNLQQHAKDSKADLVYWEFNDPKRMTKAQIDEDEKGGITTQDRLEYWAGKGAYVLRIKSTGNLVPRDQPGMDGAEPVDYLGLAFIPTEGNLDGKTISKSDLIKMIKSGDKSITDDVDTDPVVKNWADQLNALPDTEFEYVRMSDELRARAETHKKEQAATS